MILEVSFYPLNKLHIIPAINTTNSSVGFSIISDHIAMKILLIYPYTIDIAIYSKVILIM